MRQPGADRGPDSANAKHITRGTGPNERWGPWARRKGGRLGAPGTCCSPARSSLGSKRLSEPRSFRGQHLGADLPGGASALAAASEPSENLGGECLPPGLHPTRGAAAPGAPRVLEPNSGRCLGVRIPGRSGQSLEGWMPVVNAGADLGATPWSSAPGGHCGSAYAAEAGERPESLAPATAALEKWELL